MGRTTTFNVPKNLKDHLAKTLVPMLVKLGAVKTAECREEYKLKTRIGELMVVVYDNWVHCCFEDVAAARKHFGDHGFQHRLNPCSGKWNWHWFDVMPAAIDPGEISRHGEKKAHLNLLAEIVWREIEDLTQKEC